MSSGLVRLGALWAALAVAIGAFGAHGLPEGLSPERVATFETGARYHMYAALALIGLGVAGVRRRAGLLIVAGSAIFSFTLYLLVLTDTGWLGAITPIGGVLMIVGLALSAFDLRPPRA
ncbi:DUF423 domain-containing protein [Propioniferax innocua]|uniref:Uncharacterized membrane protein YgdD (TMEM256/DUF423 family) n=1 Tax=Propioniferax innocua TaxID=1753 RepID=A0A542ZQ52_9ACTN|nr:DUF423 domain-containing protein [Propioniferax innocua]TQL62396.1 uncharacterized membrane protein YgdD (TMEM256/DUF423 family) [Propioniferax innocua]